MFKQSFGAVTSKTSKEEISIGGMAAPGPSRQALRRWGNSLGVRLPVAIARAADLQEDQDIELSVVEDGVLIRPVQPRLSLEERLAAYVPMPAEPVEAMAWEPLGAEATQ